MNIEPDDTVIETPVETSIEQEVMASLDKAIEENPANDLPVEAPEVEAAADEVKPEGDKPAEAGKPEEVKADDDTAKEITALGLKGKSSERFQQMAGEIKTFAPLKEALEKAGIKDVADIPRMIERANLADQWEEMAVSTNASPEQMGMAFDYLKFANQATAGDASAAQKCWDYMANEMKVLGALLGKEAPGVVDPLEAHADLLEAIESGEISRPYALQLAANRTQGTYATQHTEKVQQQQESQQLFTAGTTSLNELGDVLAKADQHYNAKLQYFLPIVKTIRETCHPSEWAKRSRDAYLSIPDPVAAPVATRQPTPIRPGGLSPGLTPVFDNPDDALDFGLNLAKGM